MAGLFAVVAGIPVTITGCGSDAPAPGTTAYQWPFVWGLKGTQPRSRGFR